MTDQAGKFARLDIPRGGAERNIHRYPTIVLSGIRFSGYGDAEVCEDVIGIINAAHEKAVAEAVRNERKRCASIVTGLCFSDNDATKINQEILMGKE
jgi:hypothetical protein